MTDEILDMTAVKLIGLESLIGVISDDSPVGPDLEYDGEYMALSVAMVGQGLRMIDVEDDVEDSRDWRVLFTQAVDLATRTRDLRVDARLARCALGCHGVIGLAASLSIIRHHIETFWDTVHPIPDEEDGFDQRHCLILRDLRLSRYQSLRLPLGRGRLLMMRSIRPLWKRLLALGMLRGWIGLLRQ